MTSLSSLHQGQVGQVLSLGGNQEAATRFMDMGIYINEKIQFLTSLFGGNLVILSKYGKYSLRQSEAAPILVEVLSDSKL
ncbi:MAG: ferrous iron transport protein A [Bdellovibrionales bacterium]|nr:ferrous iron transport protein A [Bdellovibrionales bacterium]